MKDEDNIQQKQKLKAILRQKHMKESDLTAQQQRYGFFNLPAPLAVGDDSYDAQKENKNNRVQIEQRNVQVAPNKSGKQKNSYFSQLGFTTIGDKYLDPQKIEFHYEKHQYGKILKDQKNFVSTSLKPMKLKPPYEYQSDTKQLQKIDHRDKETGLVITDNRNIFVSPNVKDYKLNYPHYQDEYERQQQQKIKEIQIERQLQKDKQPFAVNKGNNVFNKDQIVYGIDKFLVKEVKKPEIGVYPERQDKPPPFYYSHPAKQGINKSIGKIPEYISDPIKERVRQKNNKETIPFRIERAAMIKSKPTPSIATNSINLRSINQSCI